MQITRAHFLRLSLPVTLLLVAGVTGCRQNATQTGGGNGDIVVGHFASKTGNDATFGIDTDNGVRLALKQLNEAGGWNGRKFVVRTEDDRSDPIEAKTVVTRFANDPNIVAVLGEVASTRSLAAAPVLQRAQIPMISPSSTNPEVTRKGEYIFRICFIDPFQGAVMAKFAQSKGFKRVAIMREQGSDYSIGLADVFSKEFPKGGGTITNDVSYKKEDTSFRSQLAAIKAENPDAIYVPGYYGQVGTIARQARELAIKAPLLGGDGWDSTDLVKGAGGPGGALEGCYFSNHYSKNSDAPEVKKFIQDFKAEYDIEPSALAALGYDAMMIFADAVKRANSTDRKAVRDALASTNDFKGVTGSITINAERNAEKPAVVLQVKGNEFVYQETVSP